VSIYEPQPKLSSTERALLRLLAQLVSGLPSGRSNLPADRAVLSEVEAELLLRLLEEFAASKKFIESVYFAERLTQPNIESDADIREVFLSWRKFYGRPRSMASTHWSDFLRRLGRTKSKYGHVKGLTRVSDEMAYGHFREMERLLLRRSGVGPRVQAIVLAVVDKYEREVEAARHGDNALQPGSIMKLPHAIGETIRNEWNTNFGTISISSTQAAGLMTVLTDVSVLFTTRDWGVAGTMSTIAGGFAAAAYPS
jgi:hypothetical protein